MGKKKRILKDKRRRDEKASNVLTYNPHDIYPTLGLAMIMKDEIEDLERIINDYGQYFDKIYVTVTDKKTHTQLSKKFSKTNKLVELSYFKWIDHFGKARRYNQKQIKTDYWMWIDLDDEIEGAENIEQVLKHMVSNNIDAAWFKYDYILRLTSMEPASILWRERIIRTASNLNWRDDAVHETVYSRKDQKQERLSQVMVKHRQNASHARESGERNLLILKNDWQKNHSAETAYYLGEYFGSLGDYDRAIEKLVFAAKHSKSEMFRYASWQNLFTCYYQTNKFKEALAAVDECIAINSNHPDPWFHKFMVFWAIGDYKSAMNSAEIAMKHRENSEKTIEMGHDPTLSQYKGPFDVARAYLQLGEIERAYQIYSGVKNAHPQFIKEMSLNYGKEWDIIFSKKYNDYKKEMKF